jgi:hypothetical protein
LAGTLERSRTERRSARRLLDRLRALALLHGLVDLDFAPIDALAGKRLDCELPQLRITEQHDREPARLAFCVQRENDLIDRLAEGIEVRLEGLDRRTGVEVPDIHLEHGHGRGS